MVGGSETNIPLNSSSYNTVFMRGFLHEVINKEAFLNEIKRILSEKGKFILVEPRPAVKNHMCNNRKLFLTDENISTLTKNAGLVLEKAEIINNKQGKTVSTLNFMFFKKG